MVNTRLASTAEPVQEHQTASVSEDKPDEMLAQAVSPEWVTTGCDSTTDKGKGNRDDEGDIIALVNILGTAICRGPATSPQTDPKTSDDDARKITNLRELCHGDTLLNLCELFSLPPRNKAQYLFLSLLRFVQENTRSYDAFSKLFSEILMQPRPEVASIVDYLAQGIASDAETGLNDYGEGIKKAVLIMMDDLIELEQQPSLTEQHFNKLIELGESIISVLCKRMLLNKEQALELYTEFLQAMPVQNNDIPNMKARFAWGLPLPCKVVSSERIPGATQPRQAVASGPSVPERKAQQTNLSPELEPHWDTLRQACLACLPEAMKACFGDRAYYKPLSLILPLFGQTPDDGQGIAQQLLSSKPKQCVVSGCNEKVYTIIDTSNCESWPDNCKWCRVRFEYRPDAALGENSFITVTITSDALPKGIHAPRKIECRINVGEESEYDFDDIFSLLTGDAHDNITLFKTDLIDILDQGMTQKGTFENSINEIDSLRKSYNVDANNVMVCIIHQLVALASEWRDKRKNACTGNTRIQMATEEVLLDTLDEILTKFQGLVAHFGKWKNATENYKKGASSILMEWARKGLLTSWGILYVIHMFYEYGVLPSSDHYQFAHDIVDQLIAEGVTINRRPDNLPNNPIARRFVAAAAARWGVPMPGQHKPDGAHNRAALFDPL